MAQRGLSTRIGWRVTCRRCGHPELKLVNDAGTDTASTVIVGCARCLAEFVLALQMREVEPWQPPPSQHRATPPADLDDLTRKARELVDRGASILAACNRVGIDHKTYRRRLARLPKETT